MRAGSWWVAIGCVALSGVFVACSDDGGAGGGDGPQASSSGQVSSSSGAAGASSGSSSGDGSSGGGSSSGGAASGSSSGGSSGLPLAERCAAASAQVEARYDACDVSYEIIDGGAEPPCTEERAAESERLAACLEEVSCRAMRADTDTPQAETDAYYACLGLAL